MPSRSIRWLSQDNPNPTNWKRESQLTSNRNHGARNWQEHSNDPINGNIKDVTIEEMLEAEWTGLRLKKS